MQTIVNIFRLNVLYHHVINKFNNHFLTATTSVFLEPLREESAISLRF